MARKATGQVIERKRDRGLVYALRFRADGQRVFETLDDGTTRREAETLLEQRLAEAQLGLYRPPVQETRGKGSEEPTFHAFASEWFAAHRQTLAPNTVAAYEYELVHHLLPFFAELGLSEITVAEVDRYRAHKVRERDALVAARTRGEKIPRRPLSNTTINSTITRLGQIFDVAVEYGHVPANPAKGKRRRLRPQKRRPTHLDRAAQITALLDAAGELDADARADRPRHRRALLATLVFAGLRVSEALALRWRDVDLATGRIRVGNAKTEAGLRDVYLLPPLRDELASHKVTAGRARDDLVFPTGSGGPDNRNNVRNRLLRRAVELADQRLEERELTGMPDRITPHSLRRTFASLLVAVGEDIYYVMQQMGHTDPKLTLTVYAQQMQRRDGERERLIQLVEGATHRRAFPGEKGAAASPVTGPAN